MTAFSRASDRLARSTRDLLNTLAAITAKEAGFQSLGDAWADNTAALARDLSQRLGLKVEIDCNGPRGVLRVHYGTFEQLDGVVSLLWRK